MFGADAMLFKEIDINSLQFNPFSSFKKDWALVSAGNSSKFNTMTVSWGGLGIIWQKNVSFIFIRPQRYTFEFIENNDYYSICFLEDKDKNILNICGTTSGRDTDKIKRTGLVPIFDEKAPYFQQSKLVYICRKIHGQFIDSTCFIDKNINSEYKNNDYHKIFIGEIEKCLKKED